MATLPTGPAGRAAVVTTAACLVLGTALTGTGSAAALQIPQRGGGVVKAVADGDTPYVGGKSLSKRVRLLGIQTTEIKHQGQGRNWCHGQEAKKRLAQLLVGKKVQLRSRRTTSVLDGRPLRSVYVKQKNGGLLDVQSVMLREGLAIWHPHPTEWQNNRAYHVLADQAAAARRTGTVWDTDWCGVGPNQDAKLAVKISYDPPGNDNVNVNGEYVAVENYGTTAVSLAGWHVRDLSLAMFTFPSGAYVPARGRVFVRVGKGRNGNGTYHWGLSKPLFANPNPATGEGDGAILLDPQGDFRAWLTYPCVYRC